MYEGKTRRIWKEAGEKMCVLKRPVPKLLNYPSRGEDVGGGLNWPVSFKIRDPTHVNRIPLILAVP